MAESVSLPSPGAEQRRVAAGQFERANQVIAAGDFDYAIQLLTSCCKLDPGNPVYRKTLRATQKLRHKKNARGGMFSAMSTATAKLRLKKALRGEDYLRVLQVAEEVLSVNPWDVGTHMALGRAFAAFGQHDLAVWSLEHAYQKASSDLKVMRTLARAYEKVGNFTNANALWSMIRKAQPSDEEAHRKVNDLAADETIRKGQYESALQTGTHKLDETLTEEPRLGAESATAPARGAREVEQIEAKIAAEPGQAANYLRLASLYRKLGQWDKARAALERGLAATGNAFELALELAEANIQPFRANLAAVDAKLEAQPNDPELQQLRLLYFREVNSRELDIFRRKADRFPTEMAHRLEIGVRLLQANQVDEAIQELQLARTDPRLLWKALLYLGFCFKTRKNWRLAQRNFEEALHNIPTGESTRRKEILYQLATGCADADDLAAALEWAYELANLDFGYKDIGRLIDKWQSRQPAAK